MKKSTAKNEAPVSLGTKRTCPKCVAKFYDFNKKELTCPKCNSKFDASTIAQSHKFTIKAVKKERPEPVAVLPGDDAPEAAAEFESVDDLGDDDAAEEIEVVEEKTEEDY